MERSLRIVKDCCNAMTKQLCESIDSNSFSKQNPVKESSFSQGFGAFFSELAKKMLVLCAQEERKPKEK
jgi:hypothetical protein